MILGIILVLLNSSFPRKKEGLGIFKQKPLKMEEAIRPSPLTKPPRPRYLRF
jgi:hypothetical protein